MKTEADFKAIPRLRWKLDDDRCVIATPSSKRNPKDHLYFHGAGVLGWYYQRSTKAAATGARKRIQARIGARVVRTLAGEFDGTILFRATAPSDVPIVFLRSNRGFAAPGRKAFP